MRILSIGIVRASYDSCNNAHPEYLAVRAHLSAPWQDILDLAYYSGWRKHSADQCRIASAGEDPVGGHRAGQ